jgi:hypothetical protein
MEAVAEVLGLELQLTIRQPIAPNADTFVLHPSTPG